MNSLRLSIIIPVYNLESYIEETVLSCLNQDISAKEYEIICVDDGSKDRSLRVLYALAEKYTNIRVLTKNNGGVSQTRNMGLANAKGQYIWFVDGDDLLTPNCLKYLLDIVEAEEPDILWFKMKNFNNKPVYISCKGNYESCDQRENLYDFMFTIGGGGVCVNLYRRDILLQNDLHFNEQMKYSEDVLFNFSVLQCAKKCVKTDFVAYHYRQRPGSAMHYDAGTKFMESMLMLAYEYDRLLQKENDIEWQKIITGCRVRAVRALLFSLVRSGDIENTRKIISELKQHKFYPYKLIPKALIRNNTYKQFIINLVSFLLPIEGYAMMMVRIFNFVRK